MEVYVVLWDLQYEPGSAVLAVTLDKAEAVRIANGVDAYYLVRVEVWDLNQMVHVRDLSRDWT
jgi:hypothetical protein